MEFQKLFPFLGKRKRTVQFLARFEVHLRGFCFLFFPSLFAELAVGNEIVIFRRGELESVVRLMRRWWFVCKKKQHVWCVSAREMVQRTTCDGVLTQKNKGKRRCKKNETRTLDPFKNQSVRVLLLFWQRPSRLLERGEEEKDAFVMKILMWRNLSQRLVLFPLSASHWLRSKAKGNF